MVFFLYEYFMRHRLYCDMKFYRISKIKRFLDIRKYQNTQNQAYSLAFIQHIYTILSHTKSFVGSSSFCETFD
jgi:hypothetical protein